MKELITDKKLTIANFTIIAYFLLIYLIEYYHIDFAIVGVIGELLTIPFLIAQFVLLYLSLRHLARHGKNKLTLISALALTVCVAVTLSSFF